MDLDIRTFFNEEGIDVFSEVSSSTIPDADQGYILQMFPEARSIIVFGKEVPIPAY